jgi:hypothetical protein
LPTVSPWDARYHRPAPQRHTRTFSLPDGGELTLTLQELDTPGMGIVADIAADFMQRYVGTRETPTLPVALSDGTLLRPSKAGCWSIADLTVRQVPEHGEVWPEGEWPYSFLDWYGVMKNWPGVWRKIRAWVEEIAAGEADPNPPEAGATGSGSASSPVAGIRN